MLLPVPPFVQWLQMADPQVGYAVGGEQSSVVLRLYRTADGGRRWTRLRAPAPVGPPSAFGRETVFFAARLHGSVVVERSTDGGRTWRASRALPDRRALGAGQVLRLDARRLYLAIGEGAAAGSSAQSLWRSSDGGRTWRLVSRTSTTGRPGALPFGCDKTGVGFATSLEGWAGGACAGGPAFLYRTADGGRTWGRVPLAGLGACACDVSAPRFFGRRHGAFAVDGFPQSGRPMRPVARVYWTDDGGARWRPTAPPLGRIGAATFPAPGVAWVPGTRPGSIRLPFDRLAVTTDSGRHWRLVSLPFDAQQLQLSPVSGAVAYAYGAGRLLRTADGGRSWRAVR